MATRLQVVSAEYLRELKNGQNFSLNTGDLSDHLLGHVGDRQQLKMTVQLSNSFSLGRYDVVGGDTIILKDGQSFLDEDFYQGGRIRCSLDFLGQALLQEMIFLLRISNVSHGCSSISMAPSPGLLRCHHYNWMPGMTYFQRSKFGLITGSSG